MVVPLNISLYIVKVKKKAMPANSALN